MGRGGLSALHKASEGRGSFAGMSTHGDANDARCVPDEEAYRLWRRELPSHDEVSLILTILVIGDDDDLALLQGLDGGDDGSTTKRLHRPRAQVGLQHLRSRGCDRCQCPSGARKH